MKKDKIACTTQNPRPEQCEPKTTPTTGVYRIIPTTAISSADENTEGLRLIPYMRGRIPAA
jgi:hypothetical protein